MMCFGVKERKRVKTNHCVIVLLDDTQLVHEVLASSTGQDLLDVVIKHLNLLETSYFGLRYLNNNDQLCWLDVTKSASKQLKDVTPMTVYFGVKFYAIDPCKLVEEITRYQFFLQIKQDILQARLPISFELSVELFALAVQSELGDYDPQRHLDGYVGEFQFVPNQTVDLEKRAAIYHRNHLNGQVPATAELNFLERVKWLDLYGCQLIPIQYENCDEYALGLGPTGILVLRNKFKVAHYLWPRIIKGKCQGRCFLLDVIDKNNEKSRYGFRLANKDESRLLKESVCLHKEFFQLTHSPNSLTGNGQASQRLSERFRNSIRSAINITGNSAHRNQQLAGSSGSLSSKKSLKMNSFSNKSSSSQQQQQKHQQHINYMHHHHHHHQASQRSLGPHGSSASIVGINTNYNRQQPTVVRMPSRRYSNRDMASRNQQQQGNEPASAMLAYNMNIGKSQTLKAIPTQKIANKSHNNNNNNSYNYQSEMHNSLALHGSNVAIVPPGRHIVKPSIYKASSIVNGMHTIGANNHNTNTDDMAVQLNRHIIRQNNANHSNSVNPSPRSVRSQRLSQIKRHSQSTHDSLQFVTSSASAALAPAGTASMGLPNSNHHLYPVVIGNGGGGGAGGVNTQLVGPLFASNKLNGPLSINNTIMATSNTSNSVKANNKQKQMAAIIQNDTNNGGHQHHHHPSQAAIAAYMPPPPPAYSGSRPQQQQLTQLQQRRHLFSDNESDLASKTNLSSNPKQLSSADLRHNNNNNNSYHNGNNGNSGNNDRDRNNNNNTTRNQSTTNGRHEKRMSRNQSKGGGNYLNENNHRGDVGDQRGNHHQRHHRRRNAKNRHSNGGGYDDNEAILNSEDDFCDDRSAEEETLGYNGKAIKANQQNNNRGHHHHDSYDSDTYYSDDGGASSDEDDDHDNDDQSYRSGCSSTNDLMMNNNSRNQNSYLNRQKNGNNDNKKRSHNSSSHHKSTHNRKSGDSGKNHSRSEPSRSHHNDTRHSHSKDRSLMTMNSHQQLTTNPVMSNEKHQSGHLSTNSSNGQINVNNKKLNNGGNANSQLQQSVDSQWKAIQERHNKFQQNRSRYLINGNNLDTLDNAFNNDNDLSYDLSTNDNNNSTSNKHQQQVNIKNIANKQATPIVMAMNHFFNQSQTNQHQQQHGVVTKLSPTSSNTNGFDSSLTDATQSNVSSPSISHGHNLLNRDGHHHQQQQHHHQKSLATASTSTTTSGYYGGSNSIGSGADSDSHTTVDGIGNGSTGGSSLNSNGSGNQSSSLFNGTTGLIESSSIKLMKSLAPIAAKNNIFTAPQNRHLNTNHSAVNNWQLELSSDLRRCSINNTADKIQTSSGIMKQTQGGNNHTGKSVHDRYHENNKNEQDSSPMSLSNMTMDTGSHMLGQSGVSHQTNGHLKYVSFDV